MHDLSTMIAAGRYDRVSAKLVEADFPVMRERFTARGAKIFRFPWRLNTLQADELMREDGHQIAWLETLLAYGRDRPDEQRYHPIICRPSGVYTPYLSVDDHGRTLYLGRERLTGGFRDHCGFLGVPF